MWGHGCVLSVVRSAELIIIDKIAVWFFEKQHTEQETKRNERMGFANARTRTKSSEQPTTPPTHETTLLQSTTLRAYTYTYTEHAVTAWDCRLQPQHIICFDGQCVKVHSAGACAVASLSISLSLPLSDTIAMSVILNIQSNYLYFTTRTSTKTLLDCHCPHCAEPVRHFSAR